MYQISESPFDWLRRIVIELNTHTHHSDRKKKKIIKLNKTKGISALPMKYYEENSAAMSEDDDNVDIESDVRSFPREN